MQLAGQRLVWFTDIIGGKEGGMEGRKEGKKDGWIDTRINLKIWALCNIFDFSKIQNCIAFMDFW